MEARPITLAWRVVLYGLVAAQLLAILAFLLAVFVPDLEQRAPCILVAVLFGLTSFIGLLLWSVESVVPRPALIAAHTNRTEGDGP